MKGNYFMMYNRKEEVYQYLLRHTEAQLNNNEMLHLGYDAVNASLDLHFDRSNISRLLNQLHQEGRLIKIHGRPTLYVARAPIEDTYSESYIPSIIPKGKTILDFIKDTEVEQPATSNNTGFDSYIYNNRSSMFEPINKAKSAILYPPNGLNTILFGESSVGKLDFAKCMFEYAKAMQTIDTAKKYSYLDCQNYSIEKGDQILTELFGYMTADKFQKGLLETAKNSILIINNIDVLDGKTFSYLCSAVMNGVYSPIDIPHKTFTLRTLIIGIAKTSAILDNPVIRKSFPIHIELLPLRHKSIEEMLVLTLEYLNREASLINKTIRVSKSVLSCFVMSDYPGNLVHLAVEIKQACAHSYRRYLNQTSFFINIDYDDISTEVLTNISNINERINELNDYLNLFDNEFLFFSPVQINKELEFLHDLNRNNSKNEFEIFNSVDDQLINQCIHDINHAANIQLNTIRSVVLKDVYDCVYDILQHTSLHKNENLLYGLLLHISDFIKNINHGVISTALYSIYRIARENDFFIANQMSRALSSHYRIELPVQEIEYIATYLYLSSQWIDNNYIQLLIISDNNENAKNYAAYLNSLKYKSIINWITIDSKEGSSAACQMIAAKMAEIDRGKGVILATDSEFVADLQTSLFNFTAIEFTIVSGVTIQTLVRLAQKLQSLDISIPSIKYFNTDFPASSQSDVTKTESHALDLLQQITDKLLTESLVFLNPQKSCKSLYNILLHILNDLSIDYIDELLIKFVFHCSFVIERCIRKEPLHYPSAKVIINDNETVYYAIEKNFRILGEIFSISIPSSELAMIVEIFLPYYQAHHS